MIRGDVREHAGDVIAGRQHREFLVPVGSTLAHPDVRDERIAQAFATDRFLHPAALPDVVVDRFAGAAVVERPVGPDVRPAEVAKVA